MEKHRFQSWNYCNRCIKAWIFHCYVRLLEGTFPTFHLTTSPNPHVSAKSFNASPSRNQSHQEDHGNNNWIYWVRPRHVTSVDFQRKAVEIWDLPSSKAKHWQRKCCGICRGGFHPFLQDFRLSIIKKPSDLRWLAGFRPQFFGIWNSSKPPGLVKFGQPEEILEPKGSFDQAQLPADAKEKLLKQMKTVPGCPWRASRISVLPIWNFTWMAYLEE